MKKAVIVLLTILALAAVTSGQVAAESIQAVPTTATIRKGLLQDERPGPPLPGSTDLSLPFYGKIASESPACRIRRAYDLGSINPNGEFQEIGGTTVPASGKWIFGLAGEPEEPLSVAIRVPPRRTTYKGTSYLCEETISAPISMDRRDFTPCKLARAASRGYGPAIREAKRNLRRAESGHDEEGTRYYRGLLKKFRSYLPGIKDAVQKRC